MNGTRFYACDALLEEHARINASLPGSELDQAARALAAQQLTATGLPSTRQEAWKYTDVQPITQIRYTFAQRDAARTGDVGKVAAAAARRVVFVDGWLMPDLSDLDALPAGVRVSAMTDAAAPLSVVRHAARRDRYLEDGFQWLNDAYLAAGALISVDDGVAVDTPLHLTFLRGAHVAPSMCHPRVVVHVGRGAALTLLSSHRYTGSGSYLSNVVTDITLGEHARLHYYRFTGDAAAATADASSVERTYVTQLAGAEFNGYLFAAGNRFQRHDIDVALAGRDASCAFDGFYYARGTEHVDIHLNVDHVSADARSAVAFKGIMDDRGRGVFNGRILVRKDAQRTDAQLSNRNLLLSRRAEIDTKPELEIYADDVKCAHGATVGHLDRDALFYLRARGIPEAAARAMLIRAFAEDALARIPMAEVRSLLQTTVLDRLERGAAGAEPNEIAPS